MSSSLNYLGASAVVGIVQDHGPGSERSSPARNPGIKRSSPCASVQNSPVGVKKAHSAPSTPGTQNNNSSGLTPHISHVCLGPPIFNPPKLGSLGERSLDGKGTGPIVPGRLRAMANRLFGGSAGAPVPCFPSSSSSSSSSIPSSLDQFKRYPIDSSPGKVKTLTDECRKKTHPVKLANGLRGPTIIVDNIEVVMKATSLEEVASNIFYRRLLNLNTFTCQGIDFKSEMQILDGKISKLDPQKSTDIQSNWNEIVQNSSSQFKDIRLEDDRPVLMLAEKVPGKNLFQFAWCGEYAQLTEDQKKEFFRQSGRIAMVDVLAGNLDRLVPISLDYKLDVEGGASNLANILVDIKSDKSVNLYAIDNGVDPYLMGNKNGDLALYCKFLKDLSQVKDWEEAVASNIVASIARDLKNNCGDEDWCGQKSNRTDDLKKVNPMREDLLGNMPKACLIEGIKETAESLRKSYSDIFDEKKDHFEQFVPGFLGQLRDRFDAFFGNSFSY